ncbi:MAG: 4Fe-4S binding protein [Chloroflexi bacterium]|nr:4Fe-4S binding protein [Chloroflexota bacterium]
MIAVTVDKKFCKGCNLCIANCPKDVLAVSTERGSAGFLVPAATKPEACNRCQLCEVICPDFAIVVEGDREK